MDDKNLMIRVLEWATTQEEFSFQELCEAVPLTEVEKNQIKLLIHGKDILYHNHTSFISYVDKPQTRINLFASAEDHFRLLEYQELKEARKSSKDANIKSLVAIIITIISTVIAIIMSVKSMNADINIPNKLYDKIDESNLRVVSTLESIEKEQAELRAELKVNNVCVINTDPTYK